MVKIFLPFKKLIRSKLNIFILVLLMQSIQIDGTYTYAENIKYLKIGDQVKLVSNPNNRMNKDAIGAYTTCGKKIGYVPFKSTQIDLKAKYIVGKIQLSQSNPLLLITMDWPNTNSIHCEPECIRKKKQMETKTIGVPESLVPDLKKFTKFLQNSGYTIESVGITELSDSFITLCLKTPGSTSFFHTVTKSFYEANVFKYDEFYKFGLTPKCIYIPWQTHRLEKYLEFTYKTPGKIFTGKKFQLDNLIKSGVFEQMDIISLSGPNCGMEQMESTDLAVISKKQLNLIAKPDREDWARLVIQYAINSNPYYNPDNLVPGFLVKPELSGFSNMFAGLEPGGIAYNHKLQAYCPIDLIDPINIVEITLADKVTPGDLIKLIGKLIVANRSVINLLNPVTGLLYRMEITDRIKENFISLTGKHKAK